MRFPIYKKDTLYIKLLSFVIFLAFISFVNAINVEAYGYYNDTVEYSEFLPVISEAVGGDNL